MTRQRFISALLLCVILTGCGTPVPAASTATTKSVQTEDSTPLDYDLDLVQSSPTVIYAEVYHMMNEPADYVGKLIRMEGVCAAYAYPDHTVYGCIIADATACCKQGMEFVLSEDRPELYPASGAEIVVSGRFNTYQAGEYTFCRLEDCRIEYVISEPGSA